MSVTNLAEKRDYFGDSIKTGYVEMTPEMAKEILRRNGNNRPLRWNHVKNLVGFIEQGEWQINGDTIRIDVNNNLLDGQHRLHAIIESGKTLPVIMVTGLLPESFHTIDCQNMNRTPGQMFSVAGHLNGNTAAAVSRAVFCWETIGAPYPKGSNHARIRRVSNHKLLSTYERDDCIVEAMSKIPIKIERMIPKSHAAFCYYAFKKKNPDACELFFYKLETGESLKSGDPVFAVREFFISRNTELRKERQCIRPLIMFHAFRYILSGKELKMIRMSAFGSSLDEQVRGFDLGFEWQKPLVKMANDNIAKAKEKAKNSPSDWI